MTREDLDPGGLTVDDAGGVEGVEAGVHEDEHERDEHDGDDGAGLGRVRGLVVVQGAEERRDG